MQMEAHHYCNQANADLAQCLLFDGNTAEARMMGIEYIISEKLYNTLPTEEKAYWHPHNYEILSGQLRMPGLPASNTRRKCAAAALSLGKSTVEWRMESERPPNAQARLRAPMLAGKIVSRAVRRRRAPTMMLRPRPSAAAPR